MSVHRLYHFRRDGAAELVLGEEAEARIPTTPCTFKEQSHKHSRNIQETFEEQSRSIQGTVKEQPRNNRGTIEEQSRNNQCRVRDIGAEGCEQHLWTGVCRELSTVALCNNHCRNTYTGYMNTYKGSTKGILTKEYLRNTKEYLKNRYKYLQEYLQMLTKKGILTNYKLQRNTYKTLSCESMASSDGTGPVRLLRWRELRPQSSK